MEEHRLPLTTLLKKVTGGEHLTLSEAYEVALALSEGTVAPALAGALLAALATKGETSVEIGGFVKAMREKMVSIARHPSQASVPSTKEDPQEAAEQMITLDTCGTGGDGKGTFNVSTLTAMVVAACGVRVAKHGNRSVTSKCGSADLFEALGVNIHLTGEEAQTVLSEVGLVFLFAPLFHPSMKNVVPIRQALKVRTVFNVLGPLLNPMSVDYQLIGVASRPLMEQLAQALVYTPLKGALIVHGADGLDEITLCEKTRVIEYRRMGTGTAELNAVDKHSATQFKPSWNEYTLDPRDYGLEWVSPKRLLGGTPEENEPLTLALLKGGVEHIKGDPALVAKRDIIVLNAAVLLALAGRVPDVAAGMKRAREALISGRADDIRSRLVNATQKFATK